MNLDWVVSHLGYVANFKTKFYNNVFLVVNCRD